MMFWLAYSAVLVLASALGWGIVLLGHRLIFGRWLP